MNTGKLKIFAQQSRRILMEGVKQKLRYWGFNDNGEVIDEPLQVGGGIILRDEPVDDPAVLSKWKALQSSIHRHGVEATIEEAAYTWFNRLMAIRILSKNGYDPAQLEYEEEGSQLPVIIAKARRGITNYLTKQEQERLQVFITDYSQETKAFSILISGYCHSHKLLNRVFGRLNDFTELLLPDNILAENGFIHLLNATDAIAEDDYKEVELIGWLYQFYISEKKDEVFKAFKKNKKAEAEDIPAATQIFTPNWIVKYMVQNTAGRIWLEHHPDSNLRQQMKYLVEPAEKDSSEQIPPTGGPRGADLLPDGDPIHLKLLDPATGSGHILVEGFSLLYEMYMEEFYLPAEAVENILTKNLFGLELDLRAAQLARFAVLLAAAQKEPEILKKDILPRIYAMPEPTEFTAQEIRDFLGSEGLQYEKVLTNALQLMQQAQNLGSVMQFNVKDDEINFFKQRWEALRNEAKTDLTKQTLIQKLEPFLNIFFVLTLRYEAIAANPPYMGQGNMNTELLAYSKLHYKNSCIDLMTIFVEKALSISCSSGYFGFITIPTWLFSKTFTGFRKLLIENNSCKSMLDLGRGIFGSDFGSVSFVFTTDNSPNQKEGQFYQFYDKFSLVTSPEKKSKMFLNNQCKTFTNRVENFLKIDDFKFAYWVPQNAFNEIQSYKKVMDYIDVKKGMSTANDGYFLRRWFEIGKTNFNFFNKANPKWCAVTKGGEFRRWYGNNEYVVNWEDNGKELKESPKAYIRSERHYFKKSLTYGYITVSDISFRFIESGFASTAAGPIINQGNLFYFLGYLNSKPAKSFIRINSGNKVTYEVGEIQKTVVKIDKENEIELLSEKSKDLSKVDWDSKETSWDFKFHSLVKLKKNILEESYNYWQQGATKQYYQLHANEEELNRIFIDIYGLNEELDPIVPLKDITILQEELDRKALEKTEQELRKRRQWKLEEGKWQLYVDGKLVPPPTEGELPQATVQPQLPIKKDVVMRQFISYAIGCMMGRYSLDKPGLILANQGETLDDYHRIIAEGDSSPSDDQTGFYKGGGEPQRDGGFEYQNQAAEPSMNETPERPLSPLGGNTKGASYVPDDDAIIPLMGSNCGFSDDAVYRLRHFIEVVWGSETLTQNINFLQSCLDMDMEKYLINQNHFWKDHCRRYKKKPIYWLFSSKTGAFQVLVYMHRMNKFTVQKIRDNYLLKHLQWLNMQINQLESSGSPNREEQHQLDYYRKALDECEEYNKYLKDIADKAASEEIVIDLDDGVAVNYPKFEPVVAKIK